MILKYWYFSGAKVLITGIYETDFGNTTEKTEIITVFRQRHKVTSAISTPAARFPMGSCTGFCGMIEGSIIVGDGKNAYKYNLQKDKWIRILNTTQVSILK